MTMMAVCHSSISSPEHAAMGPQQAPPTCKVEPRPRHQYSVSSLVENVHRLERLCWHVVLLWKLVVFVVRWESPSVTLSYWITSVLICYFMESSQLFASCFAFLLLLAGAGAMVNFDFRDTSEPPSPPRPQQSDGPIAPSPGTTAAGQGGRAAGTQGAEPSSVNTDRAKKGGKEALAEYRQLMLLAQDGLVMACETLERAYEVLRWQDRTWSPVFYGGTTAVLMIVCLLPLRWFVMATISCVLCLNGEFAAVVRTAYRSVHVPPSQSEETDKVAGCQELVTTPEPEPQDSLPSEVNPPPPILHDNQHRPLHLCQKSKSLDEAGPNYAKLAAANRNRSSTAPELPTLKLNSAGVPVEVCFLCGTMFSSVLKRRRYCRSCGNQFCQRCCSRKLPRAVFGATSPAAITEKELVCNACFCTMTADEVFQAASGATIVEH